MKITAIIIAIGLLLGRAAGGAQGFVNLNFASANIPTGTESGSFVPSSEAIPGWTGFLGANPQTSVLYNSLDTGSANLAILSTNSPGAIPGNEYTVVLQAGFGGPGYIPATISQTAVIPANAEFILFTANPPDTNFTAGWQVTISGQIIPVTQISTVDTYYGVYEGNISEFAGQDDELAFTALAGSATTVNFYLDNIQFTSAPEPSELALVALGVTLFKFRRRDKSSK